MHVQNGSLDSRQTGEGRGDGPLQDVGNALPREADQVRDGSEGLPLPAELVNEDIALSRPPPPHYPALATTERLSSRPRILAPLFA